MIRDHVYAPGGGTHVGRCIFPLEGSAMGARCGLPDSEHELAPWRKEPKKVLDADSEKTVNSERP